MVGRKRGLSKQFAKLDVARRGVEMVFGGIGSVGKYNGKSKVLQRIFFVPLAVFWFFQKTIN